MYFLVFDTETTGFSSRNRLVQLAWQLYKDEKLVEEKCFIVKPYKFTIPRQVVEIHGITTEMAMEKGLPLRTVLRHFIKALDLADYLIGHNVEYDIKVVHDELYRMRIPNTIMAKKKIDTMKVSTEVVKLPPAKDFTHYKYPKLKELYRFLFGKDFQNAHNALADVKATAECFLELRRRGIIKV
jgi:DNA polymerase III epsilon subunit-like protein